MNIAVFFSATQVATSWLALFGSFVMPNIDPLGKVSTSYVCERAHSACASTAFPHWHHTGLALSQSPDHGQLSYLLKPSKFVSCKLASLALHGAAVYREAQWHNQELLCGPLQSAQTLQKELTASIPVYRPLTSLVYWCWYQSSWVSWRFPWSAGWIQVCSRNNSEVTVRSLDRVIGVGPCQALFEHLHIPFWTDQKGLTATASSRGGGYLLNQKAATGIWTVMWCPSPNLTHSGPNIYCHPCGCCALSYFHVIFGSG